VVSYSTKRQEQVAEAAVDLYSLTPKSDPDPNPSPKAPSKASTPPKPATMKPQRKGKENYVAEKPNDFKMGEICRSSRHVAPKQSNPNNEKCNERRKTHTLYDGDSAGGIKHPV
jgi:hypothetical protein